MKIFILLLCIILFPQTVKAAPRSQSPPPINAVLVLDVSNSMRFSDPNRLSFGAMNLFIEMLGYGDRVGIVAYAGHVTRSHGMIAITGPEDRISLQGFINQLDYAAWTDHSLGLKEALQIMDYGHIEGHRPVIILFTDGVTELWPLGARTMADADRDMAWVIDHARQKGYPIYTIGLNHTGILDRAFIDNIAESTGARSFMALTPGEIEDIIIDILSIIIAPEPEYIPEEIYEEAPETDFGVVQAVYHPSSNLPYDYPFAEEVPENIIIPYEHASRGRYGFIGIAVALVLLAVGGCIYMYKNRNKRLFTGKLVIEGIIANERTSPQYRNLIEYGGWTTLYDLLGKNAAPVLSKVVLTPSPTAPSHLPQLFVKCLDPLIKFRKDFTELDGVRGFSMSLPSEVHVEVDDSSFLIKYTA